MTSDGFLTIKHDSNDFVLFQNNFSLNILQDLPAWEMGFKSAVKGHLSGELAWEWACPCQEWWWAMVMSLAGVVVGSGNILGRSGGGEWSYPW